MILTNLGHSKFLIELDCGYRIVTDPFDPSTGYPVSPLKANAILVSHHHHDHDAVDTITGAEIVVDTPGTCTLAPGITVTAIPADHDDAGGAKRGKTLLFLLEAEGLRVAHLGDLGTQLSAEQVKALGRVDLLMIPVGGFYTIDAARAKQVADALRPRVILPMHYRTAYNSTWPIAPVADFVAQYPAYEELPLLRVVKDDLLCQPKLAVLTPQV